MLQVEAGCIARPQAPTFEFAINDTGQHALPVAARVRVRNPRNGDVVHLWPSNFDMAAVVPRGSGETTALLSTRE